MASEATAWEALEVLGLPLNVPNDAGVTTVREYLAALLEELWTRGEGFSGKRPFGNSGWEYDLYRALTTAGYVHSEFDEDGDLVSMDTGRADALILAAIRCLGGGRSGSW